jgi:bisphosphoglycerate-dependent phosphoglycerate mutase
MELITRKTEAIFIIVGDFNSAKQPIQHLHELSKDEITNHKVVQGVPRESSTD